MLETVLYIALPYLALIICPVASVYRIRTQGITYSSLSSQFLENKSLAWGSVPWHLGIISILTIHILVFFFPQAWQRFIGIPGVLFGVEVVGLSLAIGCVAGLLVLAVRRLTSSKLQAVTTPMDLLVLLLLLFQVFLGIGIAIAHRWGAAWASSTVVPYLWSLIFLRPNVAYISDLPFMVKAHVVLAFVLILVIPFSRLIHMFAVPVTYLFRPPQVVMWNRVPAEAEAERMFANQMARRDFVIGLSSITAGLLLFAAGAIDKIFSFFFGPRLTAHEEEELLELKLKRLEMTVEQRKLELERQVNKYILVSALKDLSLETGKYLIDFQMSPAIAFLGDNGLPIIISAKCTHLGCTVGNTVTDGKILCPCHISYFDIKTGQPNAEAPAKLPLPFLPWVLMTSKGKIIAGRSIDGKISGATDKESTKGTSVYIVKT